MDNAQNVDSYKHSIRNFMIYCFIRTIVLSVNIIYMYIQLEYTLQVYKKSQPFGYHQILYMYIYPAFSFPYIGQCLEMGILCVVCNRSFTY
jgi:hypothetical protein